MNQRLFGLLYGIFAYLVFLASFVYAIGFIGNFWLPKTIDGPPTQPLWLATLINTALLGAFALQHSLMARPAFKSWWTKFIPSALERSTYVLFSSLALIGLFAFWAPLGGEIWRIESKATSAIVITLYAVGWLVVLVSTCLINHFDLFGLRQVWLYFKAQPYRPLPFQTPWLYGYVRHPLYVGWFIVFWSTPTMTATHLFFAVMTTTYILIAVRLEERDLENALPEYREYCRQVPRFIPRLHRHETLGPARAQRA